MLDKALMLLKLNFLLIKIIYFQLEEMIEQSFYGKLKALKNLLNRNLKNKFKIRINKFKILKENKINKTVNKI